MSDHLMDNAIEMYCHGGAKIKTLGSMRRPSSRPPTQRIPVIKTSW